MSSEPHLTHEDFALYQGQAFRFESWPGTLHLVAVTPHAPTGWPSHLRTPFMLRFQGPRNDLLPEAIHVAQAEDGRRFTLHIMPVHTVPADRQDYQAVFN